MFFIQFLSLRRSEERNSQTRLTLHVSWAQSSRTGRVGKLGEERLYSEAAVVAAPTPTAAPPAPPNSPRDADLSESSPGRPSGPGRPSEVTVQVTDPDSDRRVVGPAGGRGAARTRRPFKLRVVQVYGDPSRSSSRRRCWS